MPTFKIDLRKASSLKPYTNNARTHSTEQIAQLASLIESVGFTNPIIADEQGIIAGHGRLAAAQKIYAEGGKIFGPGKRFELPAGSVPVIDGSGMSEDQRRMYVLADNQSAMNADWDAALVGLEIGKLEDPGMLDLIGFDDDQLLEFRPEALQKLPDLPTGDRQPYQQKAFTLHDDQAKLVERALTVARARMAINSDLNDNRNGNALAAICGAFLKDADQA